MTIKDQIIEILVLILALTLIFWLLPAEPADIDFKPEPVKVVQIWRLTPEYTGWVWYVGEQAYYFERKVK